MRFSKRTEYAMRAMVQLSRLDPGQYVQSRDLAKQEKLPNKFLESVLLGLKRHGYLESKVGAGGGYKLLKPPRAITIGQLLRTLDSLESPDPARPDQPVGEVAMGIVRQRLAQAHADTLDKLTLEDLVDEVRKLTAANREEMYFI